MNFFTRRHRHTRFLKITALLVLPIQFITGNQLVFAETASQVQSLTQPASGKKSKVQKGFVPPTAAPVPEVPPANPPPLRTLSKTASQICGMHVLPEPFIPDGDTVAAQDTQLLKALKAFSGNQTRLGLNELEQFAKAYPHSVWIGSVETNMGYFYKQNGYYSRALDAWEAAWAATKGSSNPYIICLADSVVGQLLTLLGSLGRLERTEPLLTEIQGRPLHGSAMAYVRAAHLSHWMMKLQPGDSFKCGPYALESICSFNNPKASIADVLGKAQSTPKGFSVYEVQKLAAEVNLSFLAARPGGSNLNIPAPSVVHWKSGHFAAVLKAVSGGYLIKDPTFGPSPVVLPLDALQDEADAYLIPGPLPTGWSTISDAQSKTIFGRGNQNMGDAANTKPNDKPCIPCEVLQAIYNAMTTMGATAQQALDYIQKLVGMPTYNILASVLSLAINDVPLGYTPPVGPAVLFNVNINQYEASQIGNFAYFNMGPLAVNSWTSFLTYSYNNQLQKNMVTVNIAGGGQEIYTGSFNPNVNGYQLEYGPELESQATIWLTNAGIYERHLPNGSIQTYGEAFGTNTWFLSTIADPQSNKLTFAYTTVATMGQFYNDLQLTSITDAAGQKSTFTYGLAADPLKITSITDPLIRSASFQYSGTVLTLTKLTDEIGLVSTISYNSQNYITAINTPYGTTSFIQSTGGTVGNPGTEQFRTVQVTNPIGQQEFYMRRLDGYGYTNTDALPAPSTGNWYNGLLNYRNTFYWDRHAIDVMHGNPSLGLPVAEDLTNYFLNDFNSAGFNGMSKTASYAHIFHWLHVDGVTSSGVLESEKSPLESRVWYKYPGQTLSYYIGTSNEPSIVARILDNGHSQVQQYSYNSVGNTLQSIDPLGRTTNYVYDSTGIDLMSVTQVNGSNNDLLASYAYTNGAQPVSNHEPVSITDASGEQTAIVYNTQGQPLTITNPKSETTTNTYAGYAGTGSGNYLHTVTGPTPSGGTAPTVTMIHDKVNRVTQTTDPQGYVTKIAYDNLDRPQTVTYPDGTTSTATYSRLDAISQTDRFGNSSYYVYNGIDQLVNEFDANGGQTNITWCTCGGMGSLTDANGHTTSWARDLEGRVTGKAYPDGSTFAYVYAIDSSLVNQSIDPNGSQTNVVYNDDDSINQISYVKAGNAVATPTQSFLYDTYYPRISTSTDGLGKTTYSYNTIGNGSLPALGKNQLLNTTFVPNGSSFTLSPSHQYTYDQFERVLTSNIGAASANTSTVTYDNLGRVPTIANNLGSFTIGYYSNTGRVSSVAMPNGVTTSLTYLDQGEGASPTSMPLLSDITNAHGSTGISKFDYQYDNDNRITQWTQELDGNASGTTHWNYGYDGVGELLAAVRSSSANAVLSQYSYAYDLAGNRTSAQVSTGTSNSVTTSAFDVANKELAQSPGGTLLWQGNANNPLFSVKLNGTPATIASTQTNFTANVPVTSGNNTVQVIAEDQYTHTTTNSYMVSNIGGNTATAPTYDSNGNTTKDAAGNTYAYDVKDELTQLVYKAGGNTQFVYDGAGNRVSIVDTNKSGTVTTKQFIMGGLTPAEEYDGTNITEPVKRFYGQGFIQYSGTNNATATPYFYTRDHLGSIRELTNTAGAVVTRLDYDPYGVTSVLSGTVIPDFAYAGMFQHQPSGNYLSATRLYNPNFGRWVTRDPIQESGGLNMYAYCGNNPTNSIDPGGLTVLGRIQGNAAGVLDGLLGAANDIVAFDGWLFDSDVPQLPQTFVDASETDPDYQQGYKGGYFFGNVGFDTLNAAALARGLMPLLEDGFARLGSQLKCLREAGSCFAAGTLVQTSSGSVPIESLHVGDRVLTSDLNATETLVDPNTWKDVKLAVDNVECSSDPIQVEELQPAQWLTENNAKVGSRIWFESKDIGVKGWATILTISDCPKIVEGKGRVILKTFTHLNTDLYQLSIDQLSNSLQLTGRHRLFSVTRDEWVKTRNLTVGEHLKTNEGERKLVSIQRKIGIFRVYNIEVETDHDYFVSEAHILAHNANLCGLSDDIVNWIGANPSIETPSGGSDLIIRSQDGLRQIRFDLSNPHGLQPHVNIETFRPRNLYPGDRKMIQTGNEHVFPTIP